LGRVVDAVSHSPYWDDTAIFVVEDDAQDGADHVDAHRSIAFRHQQVCAASAQPFVDHHFYTTVSMIHTMEESARPAADEPVRRARPAHGAAVRRPRNAAALSGRRQNLRSGLIYKVNEKKAPGAKESSKMDFSRPDANDAKKLNAILWRMPRATSQCQVTSHSHAPRRLLKAESLIFPNGLLS
jgi:hypothetical protein